MLINVPQWRVEKHRNSVEIVFIVRHDGGCRVSALGFVSEIEPGRYTVRQQLWANFRLPWPSLAVSYDSIHPSIHPSFHGPVGVHCIVDCPSPEITILCLPAESMNVFLAPLLDVIQPFSVWSASSIDVPSFMPNTTFFTSLMSTDMTEHIRFSFQDDPYDVLRSSYSGPDFLVRYFLLPTYM